SPLLPGQSYTPMFTGDLTASPADKVCATSPPFPNPQLAAVFRLSDRVALGLAVVAPHSTGAANWPASLPYTNSFGFSTHQMDGSAVTEPSPNRSQLVSSNALIIYPTISVAFAPLDNLSFGAGFVWGIGTLDFVTFSEAVATPPAMGMMATDHFANDVRAEL